MNNWQVSETHVVIIRNGRTMMVPKESLLPGDTISERYEALEDKETGEYSYRIRRVYDKVSISNFGKLYIEYDFAEKRYIGPPGLDYSLEDNMISFDVFCWDAPVFKEILLFIRHITKEQLATKYGFDYDQFMAMGPDYLVYYPGLMELIQGGINLSGVEFNKDTLNSYEIGLH